MPEACIVIVTRNRKEKARLAIESALAQQGDNEVLVIDDASSDGTSDYVREHFPAVRVIRYEEQQGYVVCRTRSADAATAPVLVSIDDDALFVGDTVVRDILPIFGDPRVGAVAIPHENHTRDGRVQVWWPPLPDPAKAYVVSSFIGTAYALRRDLFLQIGGFQNYLFHWGEETEYGQRVMGAGYVIRLATSGLIKHYPEGLGKYTRKVNRYIFRNAILTVWLNAPAIYVLPLFALFTLRGFAAIVRRRNDPLTVLEGLGMGFLSIFTAWKLRKPISLSRYRLWIHIRKRTLMPLDEITPELAASSPSSPSPGTPGEGRGGG
jgi:GT2 family glycosyltransferase